MASKDREKYNAYMSEYMLKRYHARRAAAIELLGSHCVSCGSTESLNIDHVDPFDKSFSLSKLWSVSHSRFLQELTKCQLLCEDCHKRKNKVDGSSFKGKLRGEESPNAKLSEELVVMIRSSSLSHQTIANALGVTRGCVTAIRGGRTWKHVPL